MKKGISVMISTILLVVFVISLGLIFTVWSSGLLKKSVSRSETRFGTELECGDVKLKLEKVKYEYEIIIKNNNIKKDIVGYIVRVTTENGKKGVHVDNSKKDTGKIEAYDAEIYNYGDYVKNLPGIGVGDIRKIEIIPRINIDGEEIVDCPNKMVVYTII